MEDTGSYYLIAHLRILTGFSDRTIRNYLASGILQGEKINGLWHFTPQQTEDFIGHPAVKAKILAKHHGLAYDFLLNRFKREPETCMMLDLPGCDSKAVSEFFCYRINRGSFHQIDFAFDVYQGFCRVILKGRPDEVLQLVSDFSAEFPDALTTV